MKQSPKAVPLFRKRLPASQMADFFREIYDGLGGEELFFVCIGTDRSTGDALGPLVGTMLKEAGYSHVLGTLHDPLDASNLHERLTYISSGSCIIAIDACLGQAGSLGFYQVSNQPIEPGKSLGKQLRSIGHYSIAAVVNVNEGDKYKVLQTTSLHFVMKMASQLVEAICEAIPVQTACKQGVQ